MFTSLFSAEQLSVEVVAICCLAALVIGVAIALVYKKLTIATPSFMITISLLPIVVSFVIMMVNGNLGTGVAVMGAFSLVRFRSVAGTSREILFVFIAMACGIAIGMGEVMFALFLTLIILITCIILHYLPIFNTNDNLKELRITMPEDLNYDEVYNDVFKNYCKSYQLLRVRTIQLGSLFECIYEIELKKGMNQKQFIDELRVRNANLSIVLSRRQVNREEL